MRVGLAQINPTVGDIEGNARLILESVHQAQKSQCDLLLFPEMALTGYPPEDLLLKPSFITDNLKTLRTLSKKIDLPCLIGFVNRQAHFLFNAAAWIEKKKVVSIYHKQCLPNYGVFDEHRYFSPGKKPLLRTLKGLRIGVTICEDLWLSGPHLTAYKKMKADVVVNISASPYHVGKLNDRHKAFAKTQKLTGAALLYCNMVGGQDELVFDGGSFGLPARGIGKVQFPQFDAGLYTVEVERRKKGVVLSSPSTPQPPLKRVEEIYGALVLGVKDYMRKNGFRKAALGLSGGIDSALVAALATDALGPENVVGVTMPSRFNLSETISDAALLAKNLGITFHEIPIQPIFDQFLFTLKPIFKETQPNIAEENLQARIRGNLLMALSNKFGWLILTTGNKSETSTGYCTLYGDTAGGLAVIKDVLKTTVYELARFINTRAGWALIPESTINRPPTAELRENQKDEEVLGPYSDLDPIIVNYVEKNQPLHQQISKNKTKESYIRRILNLIDRNEYKRRQAPPGIKITPRSFGKDHRMPITNRYTPL
ncbi:MAG: Glutamine-dependent NAD(+) synthetase [Elusimicrobia bacterium]|nr:Glutamine-dependent NAD(+) synthetase [Elusimicrobiota bacterium]